VLARSALVIARAWCVVLLVPMMAVAEAAPSKMNVYWCYRP
jgi:hypothetical protein